jgi:hypothetical protein
MGYTKNAEGSSNPKSVLTFGFPNHDDHVHVSNMTKSTSQQPTSGGATSSGTTNSSSGTTDSDKTYTYSGAEIESDPLIVSVGNILNKVLNLDKGLTENLNRIKRLLK